jgi:photosystem I subunit PsaN
MATTSFLGSAVALPAALSVRELKGVSSSISTAKVGLTVRANGTATDEEYQKVESRRSLLKMAAVVVAGSAFSAAAAGNANAGLVEDLLAKSAANKDLNDKKRLATSGANTARAYTVLFGTCKAPENFTGCEDLAKKKEVKFLTEDINLECEGKDKFKCGSNVFWKWGK